MVFPRSPPSTSKLVQVYLDTATFDEIERDEKVKFTAALGLVGGTMELLTGISIINGSFVLSYIKQQVDNIKRHFFLHDSCMATFNFETILHMAAFKLINPRIVLNYHPKKFKRKKITVFIQYPYSWFVSVIHMLRIVPFFYQNVNTHF